MERRITDERILMKHVIKMLPKGIPEEAIESVECDPMDGGPDMEDPSYWVYLSEGYICPLMECHTIHEDTLADLKIYVGSVKEWPDDPELSYKTPQKKVK